MCGYTSAQAVISSVICKCHTRLHSEVVVCSLKSTGHSWLDLKGDLLSFVITMIRFIAFLPSLSSELIIVFIRIDSITWDIHKSLSAPLQCSVFLTKHKVSVYIQQSRATSSFYNKQTWGMQLAKVNFGAISIKVNLLVARNKVTQWMGTFMMTFFIWFGCGVTG